MSLIPYSVLRQVYSFFQRKFSTECDLVLPPSNFQYRLVSWKSPSSYFRPITKHEMYWADSFSLPVVIFPSCSPFETAQATGICDSLLPGTLGIASEILVARNEIIRNVQGGQELNTVTSCRQTGVSQHTNASLKVAAGSYYCIFIDISTNKYCSRTLLV